MIPELIFFNAIQGLESLGWMACGVCGDSKVKLFITVIRNVLTRRREYGTYLAIAHRHRRRLKMQKRDE